MESGRYDPINECVSIILAFFAVRDFRKLLLLCVYVLRQMYVCSCQVFAKYTNLVIDPRLQFVSIPQHTVSLNGIFQFLLTFFAFVHQVLVSVKKKWLASNFSQQSIPWIILGGHENKGIDHQIKKLLIVKQILFVSMLRNVQRICVLMLGNKGLIFGRMKLLQQSLILTYHPKPAVC